MSTKQETTRIPLKAREPFATHVLPNGWVVREHHALAKHAYVARPANAKGDEFARFVVRYNRRHHAKIFTVMHLIGSTKDEQEESLRTALKWASRPTRIPLQGLWRRRKDQYFLGCSYYTIIVGGPIDEQGAFESIRRGLHTDDSIELEFQSIVQQLEGVTA